MDGDRKTLRDANEDEDSKIYLCAIQTKFNWIYLGVGCESARV